MAEGRASGGEEPLEPEALLESAPDAMVITDERGAILRVNGQTERLFGYTREELIGQPVETLMPERFRRAHVHHREDYRGDARLRPMGSGLDLRGRRKDGSEFPVEISLSPIRSGDRQVVVAAIRDVSDRQHAQRELERLRRQQELLLQSVGEGIVSVDASGVITYVNPAGAKLLGFPVEELLGRAEHEALHRLRADGSPYPRERCPVQRSFHDGTIHHASGEVFWRKDGTSFPVEYTSAPIREDGRIVGASIIFADISDRIRAEELAQKAEKRLLSIYESIPEAFFALDRDFRLLYMNPVAERMRQTPKETVLGRVLWDAFPDLKGSKWESEYRRALRDKTRVTVQEYYPPLDRWFEATAYPTDEGLSVYFRDVTDRKANEAQLQAASIARPLARRIVQDLVEQGGVAHQILTQVGRKLAADQGAAGLEDYLAAYTEMGLGNVEIEKQEGGRASFTGTDLLERRPDSRVATCYFTLGYLSEAVSRIHAGEPTLGTEIECQSRGAPRCRFIVQVKKPEEGLARRVKELI